MHFAARLNGKTYGEFASDYKVLVDSNIRAMEYFDADMVGLISDPHRETAAFGAKMIVDRFVEEGVRIDGVIALGGGRQGEVGMLLVSNKLDLARDRLASYMSLFPGRFYMELQRTGRDHEEDY